MDTLLKKIRHCTLCQGQLPHGTNPVVQAATDARLLIIGQAPGRRVHDSGIPWNDASGNRLRKWLQIDEGDFYNPEKVAIMPMGFCYPGTGASGDLPPRPECAETWHQSLLQALPDIQLTLLIGQYAQSYYLSGTDWAKKYSSLTEKVRHAAHCPAPFFPLPHPSPRNNRWLVNNGWFDTEILPLLRKKVHSLGI